MAKNNEKYAYLNRLSTEQLEELLRMDMEEGKPGNEGVVFHILEVIEQRENKCHTGRIPDVDKAWEAFQEYYDVPEEGDAALYPCGAEPNGNTNNTTERSLPHKSRFRRYLKQALVAAIAVAAVLGGMVVAQASGIDVFGMIGRWTDDVFHFMPVTDESSESTGVYADENAPEYDALREALASLGIDEALAPTWYPESFTLTEPEIKTSRISMSVTLEAVGPDGSFVSVDIIQYSSTQLLPKTSFEKDARDIEYYSNSKQDFYILSNLNTTTAVWSDGLLVQQITGNLSGDDIKKMIDSIGGNIS